LPRPIKDFPYQKMGWNAPIVILKIQDWSVNSAVPPVNLCFNAMTAKSRLIISNAIRKKAYNNFILNLPESMLAAAPLALKTVPLNVPVAIPVA